MDFRIRLLLLCLVVMSSILSTDLTQNLQLYHRIDVRIVDGIGEFYDTISGDIFTPRGVNYIGWTSTNRGIQNRVFDTSYYDAKAIRADFHHLVAAGYNTVRLFFDSCNAGPTCIGNSKGQGLNTAYIANIAEVIQIAAEEGIYLVLTSNDLPDDGAYWDISNEGASDQFAGYRNAHYLTEQGVKSAEKYWRDFMGELMAFDPPTEAILGWSILNEQWFFKLQAPLSMKSGTVATANGKSYDLSDPEQKRQMLSEGIIYYIEAVSTIIRENDYDSLVTMGFFVPQFPNDTDIGGDWYVDTEPLLASANLDFFDFHAYPGLDITISETAENFGMKEQPEIPVIMGEVGAFRHIYESADLAAIALQEWIAESCNEGYDGWLLWDYFGAPHSIADATWGSLAEDGLIFDALAPHNQVDPCQTTNLRPRNIAFRQHAFASNFLSDEVSSNVTDGSAKQWGSGADAPQWIQIEIDPKFAINQVSLRVAQYPAGETHHQVWAFMVDGNRILMQDFQKTTKDDDILTVRLDAPLTGIASIRVDTLVSPSWVAWKEIEVFEGGVGLACVIHSSATVNLRSEATTSSQIAGSLGVGMSAIADQKTKGDDNLLWYHLSDQSWVREDVITTSGDCDSLDDIQP